MATHTNQLFTFDTNIPTISQKHIHPSNNTTFILDNTLTPTIPNIPNVPNIPDIPNVPNNNDSDVSESDENSDSDSEESDYFENIKDNLIEKIESIKISESVCEKEMISDEKIEMMESLKIKHKVKLSKDVRELTSNIYDYCENEDIYVSDDVPYYKISVGIPDDIISVNEKTKDFAVNVIGGSIELLCLSEEDYWDNLKKSKFICIANNDESFIWEALSCGCIPYLLNVKTVPLQKLYSVPSLLGLSVCNIDMNVFPVIQYNELLNYFYDYIHKYVKCTAIIESFFKTIQYIPKIVLFLIPTCTIEEFELQSSVLYGLKKHLGNTNVIDYPVQQCMYSTIAKKRHLFPRHGYTYAYKLNSTTPIDRTNIEEKIKNKEFDIIIITGIFSKESQKITRTKAGDFPFQKSIYKNYPKNKLIFIDGHTNHKTSEETYNILKGKGLIFRR